MIVVEFNHFLPGTSRIHYFLASLIVLGINAPTIHLRSMQRDNFFLLDSPDIFADRGTMFTIRLRVDTPLVTLPSLLDCFLHATPPFGRHRSRSECSRLCENYKGKRGEFE